jgi:2,4-dienoyl-CoA reductase-like NADH-dependent reductase (Old Yellow Enzyme family)
VTKQNLAKRTADSVMTTTTPLHSSFDLAGLSLQTGIVRAPMTRVRAAAEGLSTVRADGTD